MSFTFTVSCEGVHADAWRVMTGMQRCSLCSTYIGSFNRTDEHDELPGETVLIELSDPPDFGTEHDSTRCDYVRARR